MLDGNTGNAFEQAIENLREQRGDSVATSEISEVVESLMRTMEGDFSSLDLQLYNELNGLSRYIQRARAEIAAIQPDEIRDTHIPTATDELDAIVSATEEATGTILDAAETLEGVIGSVDEQTGQKITDVVTSIYEACNFQDITGQRITKVVTTLQHIEAELEKVMNVFGDGIQKNGKNEGSADQAVVTDKDLLNGPQLNEHASSQDEIDALFASMD